jgi:hypothetical protein
MAQNSPKRPGPARPTREWGAYPRTRPQPGPGPGKPSPAWAKSGPCARGSTATVRSRSTVARRFRRVKTPARPRLSETLATLFSPPVFASFHARERGRRPAARSKRRHGEPPRRRARSPQGERAAVERRLRGAQIYGAAGSTTRATSIHPRQRTSRDLVKAPASRAR